MRFESNYRISDPKYIPPEKYQKARDEFISEIKNVKGVKSIYGTGKVSAPGFSDIDFFLILDDSVNTSKLRKKHNRILDKYPYLFMHSAALLTEEAFKNLPLVSGFDYLRHRAGRKYNMNISAEDSVARSIIFFDFVLDKWYSEPLSYLVKDNYAFLPNSYMKYVESSSKTLRGRFPTYKNIDLRLLLCRMHNIVHDVKLAKTSFGIEYHHPVIDTVEDFRESYFEEDITADENFVKKLLSEYLEAQHELLKLAMDAQDIYPSSALEGEMIPAYNPKIATNHWKSIEPERRINISQGLKLPVSHLPTELYSHYLNYHKTIQIENQEIKDKFEKKKHVSKNLNQFQRKHDLDFLICPIFLFKYENSLKNKIRDLAHRRITRQFRSNQID